jgi:hypothetical protein
VNAHEGVPPHELARRSLRRIVAELADVSRGTADACHPRLLCERRTAQPRADHAHAREARLTSGPHCPRRRRRADPGRCVPPSGRAVAVCRTADPGAPLSADVVQGVPSAEVADRERAGGQQRRAETGAQERDSRQRQHEHAIHDDEPEKGHAPPDSGLRMLRLALNERRDFKDGGGPVPAITAAAVAGAGVREIVMCGAVSSAMGEAEHRRRRRAPAAAGVWGRPRARAACG